MMEDDVGWVLKTIVYAKSNYPYKKNKIIIFFLEYDLNSLTGGKG